MLRLCLRHQPPRLHRTWRPVYIHITARAALHDTPSTPSTISSYALESLKDFVLDDPKSRDPVDIRDVFNKGTPRPAPTNQEHGRKPQIADIVDIPTGASQAYAQVPASSRRIFRLDNVRWQSEIEDLVTPGYDVSLADKDIHVVLVGLLLTRELQPRALRMFKHVLKNRHEQARDIFPLIVIEKLIHAAIRAACHDFLSQAVITMFQLHFPGHTLDVSIFPLAEAPPAPASDAGAKRNLANVLKIEERLVGSRIFSVLIDSVFDRHRYPDVVELHAQMIDCHLAPTTHTYNRVLQSYFRWFLYPDLRRPTSKHFSFEALVARVHETLDDMVKKRIYADKMTRAILIQGMTRCILRSPLREVMKRWKVLGPLIVRLRSSDDGNMMVRTAWTEGLLELVEARRLRVNHQLFKQGYDHPQPPNELESLHDAWFSQSLEAMQRHLTSFATENPVYDDLSLPRLTYELRIISINMRTSLMREDVAMAGFWLRQLKPPYDHAMQRLALPESQGVWKAVPRDLRTRYESSMIRFISHAIDRGLTDTAVGAMTMGGSIHSAYTVARLWCRIFALQAREKVGWHGPDGVLQALQLFMVNIEAHTELSVVRPRKGPHPLLGRAWPIERLIAHQVWAAAMGSSTNGEPPLDLPSGDGGRRERLAFLRGIYRRCGLNISDVFWYAVSGAMADYCATYLGQTLHQESLDKLRREFYADEPALGPGFQKIGDSNTRIFMFPSEPSPRNEP